VVTANRISLPRPHAAQREILSWDGNAVIFAGRRFGKTQVFIYRLLMAATNKVGLYWWIGLTWRSASMKRAWRLLKYYVRKIWQALGKKPDTYIREADKELYLPNGSAIWMRSAERPDSLAGEGVDGAIVDEFSLMDEIIWTEYLEAALLDREGWAWLGGVPKGENWATRLWRMAHERAGWRFFHFTTYDNPKLSRERIDDIKANTPEVLFEQEYLAQITPDAGAVFRGVRHVLTAPTDAKPIWKRHYIGGLDWARHHDYTVLVILDAVTREMVAMDRFNKVDWALQRGRIRELYDTWLPDVIYAESNSIGEPNIEALQMEGLPVHPYATTSQSKPWLIGGLALAIERKEIALLPDDVLVNELQSYTMERLPSGGYRYGAPSGMHDDCVIALALAWQGVSIPSVVVDFDFNNYRGG
jgi:hypothetical protein